MNLLLAVLITSVFASDADTVAKPGCDAGKAAVCGKHLTLCGKNCGNQFYSMAKDAIAKQIQGAAGSYAVYIVPIVLAIALITLSCYITGKIVKMVLYFFICSAVFSFAIASVPFMRKWAINRLENA